MSVVIDATVGGASANSYVDLAYANTYHESLPTTWVVDWAAASDDNKNRALVSASSWLDYAGDWKSAPVTETQARRHPRKSLTDVDGDTIADTALATSLLNATCELSRHFLSSNRTAPSDTEGISSLSVPGAVAISFTPGNTGGATIPESVRVMVDHLVNGWNDPKTGASTNKMARA